MRVTVTVNSDSDSDSDSRSESETETETDLGQMPELAPTWRALGKGDFDTGVSAPGFTLTPHP